MKTLDVHGIEVLSMGTKVGQGFVNVPISIVRHCRGLSVSGITGGKNPWCHWFEKSIIAGPQEQV